jgi:hypothetical protein
VTVLPPSASDLGWTYLDDCRQYVLASPVHRHWNLQQDATLLAYKLVPERAPSPCNAVLVADPCDPSPTSALQFVVANITSWFAGWPQILNDHPPTGACLWLLSETPFQLCGARLSLWSSSRWAPRARRGPAGPRACGPTVCGPEGLQVSILSCICSRILSGICVWHFFLVFILAFQQSFSHISWRKLTLSDPRVLSGISFGILSGICVWHVFSHSFWHSIWHNFSQFLLPCYLASLLEFFLAYAATEYCIFSLSLWHSISPRRL